MTRKDYEAIAKVFRDNGKRLLTAHESSIWLVMRQDIADVLAADNPRFQRERFYAACEGEGEGK